MNRGRFTGLLQNICSGTYVALWDMVYDKTHNVTLNCKGLQTQIGSNALLIERVLQDVVSVWDL